MKTKIKKKGHLWIKGKDITKGIFTFEDIQWTNSSST